MSIFHTTANGAGPTWRQLGDTDYGAIGFTTVVDVSAALLMSHVVCEASWPVYAATIPQIVVFSSLAAIVATIGVSMRYGMWGVVGEDLGCNTVAWVAWLGLGALFSTAFLRVFRYHDVLVKRSGVMWPVVCQLLGLMLLCTLAPALLTSPGMATFDSVSMECLSTSFVPEYFGFGILGFFALSTLVLTFRLRVARVQAPHEFATAIGISYTLVLASACLPLLHFKTEPGQKGRREGMLALTALASLGVAVIPVLRYVKGFVVNEEELKKSGDFNFGKWRSKEREHHRATLSRTLDDAANSPGGRITQEFPAIAEFFRVLMARETIDSYPLLQASTMRILDTYCREGAPSAVAAPMSNACRSTTLSCKASSAFIFDTARSEMLQKMGIEIEPHRSDRLRELPKPTPIGRSKTSTTSRASSDTSGTRMGVASPQTPSDSSPAATTGITATTVVAAAGSAHIDDGTRLESPREQGILTSGSSEMSSGWSSSTAMSPLHMPLPSPSSPQPPASSPPVPSPLNPKYIRRSAAVSGGEHHDPNMPLSPPLKYRGVNSKKEEDTNSGGGGGGGSVLNPIASLFSKLGGGGGSKSRRPSLRAQDSDKSNESSPPVVHMVDEDDAESGTNKSNDNNGEPTEHADVTMTMTKGRGKTHRGLGGTGVSKVAGVQDLDAAFGLKKGNDDEDEMIEYTSSGIFGSFKKKKKKTKVSPAFSGYSGIGGYGNMSMLDSPSSPDGGTDLADAARAIERPLFGDTSRGVGRQNPRAGATAARGRSRRTPTAFYGPRPLHISNTRATATTTPTATNSSATFVPGDSQELSNALHLDLEQEGGGGAAALTNVEEEEDDEEEEEIIGVVNPLESIVDTTAATNASETVVNGDSQELSNAFHLDLEQEGGGEVAAGTEDNKETDEDQEQEQEQEIIVVVNPLAGGGDTTATYTVPTTTDITNGAGEGGGEEGIGGGTKVLEMARRFEAEARAQRFGDAVVTEDDDDDNKTAPPGKEGSREVDPLGAYTKTEEEEEQEKLADCV